MLEATTKYTDARKQVPPTAKYIHDTLKASGFESYIVGGYVRDLVLGRNPHDCDMCTNATPEQMVEVFKGVPDINIITTGLKHGTLTIVNRKNGYAIELTTYRIDGEYTDSRHPDSVTFVSSVEQDLQRRDFTINALIMDAETGEISGLPGWQNDITNHIIRAVGDPHKRIKEDALRMLRAFRFSAQLGYEIDPALDVAIFDLSYLLKEISAERIRDEIEKILFAPTSAVLLRVAVAFGSDPRLAFLKQMKDTPQFNHWCNGNVLEHTVSVINSTKVIDYIDVKPLSLNKKALLWGCLMHDCGKPDTIKRGVDGEDHFIGHPEVGAEKARDILLNLKLDLKTITEVEQLVRYHDRNVIELKKTSSIRKFLALIDLDYFDDLCVLKLADAINHNGLDTEVLCYKLGYLIEYVNNPKNTKGLSMKTLEINGEDLKNLGIEPGPAMGRVLKALLKNTISDPNCNTKEWLSRMAIKLHKKEKENK